jgi:mono/diheme cytochrome c family protein
MKGIRSGALRGRRALTSVLLGAGLFALIVWASSTSAQSPIPHAIDMKGEDCLSCHQSGITGAPRMAWDHLGRTNEDCVICHQASGAPASEITHPVAGREDCLSCHLDGVGDTPGLAGNHLDYSNEACGDCHLPSLQALEPTPIPTAVPTPEAEPVHVEADAGSCVSCHQLIFADEEHMVFTGQPLGDGDTGAELYGTVCATCHGEDGSTPVGDEGSVISAEAYWSAHDDAAILEDIGIGSHGAMTAFAREYGGPLSWEEILDVAAFVRSWGPVRLPEGMPSASGVTYGDDVGPLLTERCGACHGAGAGLNVTDYGALMAGASSGLVIVPSDPDGSPIVQVLLAGHFATLSDEELGLLVDWITSGATE